MYSARKTAFYAGMLFFSLSVLGLSPAYGQLQIGDVMPEARFEEVKNASSADFPASSEPVRLYILDFWSKWCGSCIVSFPKVEGLQYQFRNEIKITAINPWNDDEEVRQLFDRYHKSSVNRDQTKLAKDNSWEGSDFKPQMTSLPALNGDTTWLDLFEIKGVPHHIWLDGKGKVIAVTSPFDVNASNIEYYLRTGVLPALSFKPYPGSYWLTDQSLTEIWGNEVFSYKEENLKIRPFYGGNGGNVFGYERLGIVDSVKKTIRYCFVNTPVADMYKAAWAMAGKEHYRPQFDNNFLAMVKGDTFKFPDVLNERLLWEVSVPEYFVGPVNKNYVTSDAPGFNEWSFRAKFCAELELPLDRKEEAAEILFEGLNNYFEEKFGISARIETRKRNCLVLKKREDFQPLEKRTEKPSYAYDPERKVESYLNYPFNIVFLDYIPYRIDHNDREKYWRTNSRGTHYEPRLTRNLPVLDETGITGNVDIGLHDVPDHIHDPVEAFNMRLKGTGLYVEKEVREIEMLVISDSPFTDGLNP